MTYGIGIWYMVCGMWYVVYGIWHMVYGIWHDIWHMIYNIIYNKQTIYCKIKNIIDKYIWCNFINL